jgi:hypothetical protein
MKLLGHRRTGTALQLKGPSTVRKPMNQSGASPETIVLETSLLPRIPLIPAPMWFRALFIVHTHEPGMALPSGNLSALANLLFSAIPLGSCQPCLLASYPLRANANSELLWF